MCDRDILRFWSEAIEKDTEMVQSIADPHCIDKETETVVYLSIGRTGIRTHNLGNRLGALKISM